MPWSVPWGNGQGADVRQIRWKPAGPWGTTSRWLWEALKDCGEYTYDHEGD